MTPSRFADPPEEDMAFAHRAMMLLAVLVGLSAALFGAGGFVYFVIL